MGDGSFKDDLGSAISQAGDGWEEGSKGYLESVIIAIYAVDTLGVLVPRLLLREEVSPDASP
jgi:hypothetical protein